MMLNVCNILGDKKWIGKVIGYNVEISFKVM